MARSVELTLPFPPSINDYWGHRSFGRGVSSYLTKRAKQFRQDGIDAVRERWPSLKPIEGPVFVVYELCGPDQRKRDLNNFLKGVEDALTHAGFWEDDSQIDGSLITRGPIGKPGCLHVRIFELKETMEVSLEIDGERIESDIHTITKADRQRKLIDA